MEDVRQPGLSGLTVKLGQISFGDWCLLRYGTESPILPNNFHPQCFSYSSDASGAGGVVHLQGRTGSNLHGPHNMATN